MCVYKYVTIYLSEKNMNEMPHHPENQNNSNFAVNAEEAMATNMPIPSAAPINPLLQYYRQPKIYVKLPSQGRFYPAGALDTSETGDYAVFAMTAKDELMFKTPDALMNGQATVEVIKSCIPAIKNPWQMPSIDLDAVLIAIRVATYGDNMSITARCTKCDEENDYDVNLVAYLESISGFEYQDNINIDPLTIVIKPYSYKEVTKAAIKALEQEKIFDIINNDEMSDEEKIDKFGESFINLTSLTVNIITNSIIKIITPDGEVTDSNMIQGFIDNAPKEVFQKIKDHVEVLREMIELKSHKVVCSECGHEFEVTVTMDQANFFGVKS